MVLRYGQKTPPTPPVETMTYGNSEVNLAEFPGCFALGVGTPTQDLHPSYLPIVDGFNSFEESYIIELDHFPKKYK